jgi:3-(3-hydroxy-phenyl)propionate hydroxylase
VAARPAVQLPWDEPGADDEVLVVGDVDGSLKRWFDGHPESVLLIRPDRIVGGASQAYAASDMVRAFDAVLGAPGTGQPPAPSDAGSDADANAELTPLVAIQEER